MKTNSLNLIRTDYKGGKSTLCSGCGHDSITNNLISALFLNSVDPYSVAKLSGIGCSSKTTAYFLSHSSGFNSLHGRMAPLATGVHLANQNLNIVGISGDGDSASIGLGSFLHLFRRNVKMCYILEDNGVYGLTKGQFSAMADRESKSKAGTENLFGGMDLCAMALQAGATFVARSFSGDSKQLVPLLRAALQHGGTGFIDVISPCVTFANHEGSTKSYDFVKEHNIHLHEIDIIAEQSEIQVEYKEGEVVTLPLPSGEQLVLKKLDSKNHDVTNKVAAISALNESKARGELLTGLFYCVEPEKTLTKKLNLGPAPLARLPENQIKPDKNAFLECLEQWT